MRETKPPSPPSGASEITHHAPAPAEQLDFLAAEVRKAVAIFDRIDLRDYFRRLGEGDQLAKAIAAASEHLAPALNILGRRH